MRTLRTPLVVFLIFIIALFFRTYRIVEFPPGLYPDEAMNGSNALEAISTGDYRVYYPENNGREGLFMNIQAQFLRFLLPWNNGMPEPWMLRLASAFFGACTVLGLYVLGKELFSERVGLLASFFLATSFWHIMFSRIGFRAIMAPFFLIWGLALLLIAIRKTKTSYFPVLSPIFAGIFYGLGFYSYIAYRVSPLILLTLVPLFYKQRGFWKVAFVFIITTFLTALPIGLYYLYSPADFLGRTSQVSIFSSATPLQDLGMNVLKTIGMIFVIGDYNPRHNLPARPELFFPVAIFLIIGTLFGVQKILSRAAKKEAKPVTDDAPAPASKINPMMMRMANRPLIDLEDNTDSFLLQKLGPIICFAWLILTMLPVVISNEGLPHALRSILMIPALMLLAAYGIVLAYDKLAFRLTPMVTSVLLGLFFLLLLAEAYHTYFMTWVDRPDVKDAFAANYVALGREIRSLPPEVPKYIIVYAQGVEVRGIPVPAQTVMYMTDSFGFEKQQAKNIHYLTPERAALNPPPPEAKVFELR